MNEDGESAIRLRLHSGALDVLVSTEANVWWRITAKLEQLCAGVLAKHAFAKCPEFLPFESAKLWREAEYT